MKNLDEKIYDFLIKNEKFYIDEIKSEYNDSFKWIALKQFKEGTVAIVICNDVDEFICEKAAEDYLKSRFENYNLHIIILSSKDSYNDSLNTRCGRIVVNKEERKVIYSDEISMRLAEAVSYVIKEENSKRIIKNKKSLINITNSIIIINIFMFIVSAYLSGGFVDINGYVLLKLGAKYGPLIEAGQYYRLFTCTFLHGGIMHLLCNMYSLYAIGPQIEDLYGKKKYMIIYIISGIGSSLLSYILEPRTLSVGASGAIFGLLGALLIFALKNRKYINRGVISNLFIVIIFNLYIGVTSANIDNFGHIGGLITGAVLAELFLLRK